MKLTLMLCMSAGSSGTSGLMATSTFLYSLFCNCTELGPEMAATRWTINTATADGGELRILAMFPVTHV